MEQMRFIDEVRGFFSLLGDIGKVSFVFALNRCDPGYIETHSPPTLSIYQDLAASLLPLYAAAQRSPYLTSIETLTEASVYERISTLLLLTLTPLYRTYEVCMAELWRELSDSRPGGIPLEHGLYALYWHNFCCCLRNLLILPPDEVYTWLGRSKLIWESLSRCQFSTLLAAYGQEPTSIQALLLSTMQECGAQVELQEEIHTALASRLNETLPGAPSFLPHASGLLELNQHTKTLVEKLLAKQAIQEKYRSLFRHTFRERYREDLFSSLYCKAKVSFVKSLSTLRGLLENWKAHGITLPSGHVLLNTPVHTDVGLVQGYWVFVAAHEFAHFVLRFEQESWRNFFSVHTPDNSPDTIVREAGQSSEPISRGETTSYLRHLLSDSFAKPLQNELLEIAPVVTHGEAGKQVEETIFGENTYQYIGKSAAELLCEFASQDEMSFDSFIQRFQALNRSALVAKEASLSVSKGFDRTRHGAISLQGYCGLTLAPF